MKLFAAAVLSMCLLSIGLAGQSGKTGQSQANANASANANALTDANGNITLDAGSQITADMTSSLNLKKAKAGDTFKMKLSKPVKKQGKEIISKGSTITGHIQEVKRVDKTTQATMVFDRLQDRRTQASSTLIAVVTAIAKPKSEALAMAMAQEEAMAATSPVSTARTRSSQQGGGLLGGVTQTVGGVTQGVTQTVGGVTQQVIGATGQLGSTVNTTTGAALGANGSVGGLIQITNDSTSSAGSGSTLTVADKNAKLENGTQFLLQTTSAMTLTKPSKQQ